MEIPGTGSIIKTAKNARKKFGPSAFTHSNSQNAASKIFPGRRKKPTPASTLSANTGKKVDTYK